jgi:hypothetical protein
MSPDQLLLLIVSLGVSASFGLMILAWRIGRAAGGSHPGEPQPHVPSGLGLPTRLASARPPPIEARRKEIFRQIREQERVRKEKQQKLNAFSLTRDNHERIRKLGDQIARTNMGNSRKAMDAAIARIPHRPAYKRY